ncbi:hypothetical protein SeMB42_g07354 [Synchytrium endobioticum]|nr:hypothetical protein SeMB42_g07354 [Synchytrium endobioticum]
MLKAGYTYTGLLELVNEDIGWLPVYLAHEYLVIARALYDIKRMHYYTEYCKLHQLDYPEMEAANRLYEYWKFIVQHQNNRDRFPNSGDVSLGNTARFTEYVDIVRQNLETLVGPGVERTSEPMVTSTDSVYTPTPVLHDFFPPAEQASGISYGTHYTEGYQAPTYFEQQSLPLPPSHHGAVESPTHGHDDHNTGNMPMHDGSSTSSYYQYYSRGSLDGWNH